MSDSSSSHNNVVRVPATSWSHGYSPVKATTARIWREHHAELEPLIARTGTNDPAEARRIASAILDLLAWAQDEAAELRELLAEDVLERFLSANPTGLSDGSLGNVRARVRKVIRVAERRPSSWSQTYRPRKERWHDLWMVHREVLGPVIDALEVPDEYTRSQIAAAVLGLLAWGLHRVGTLRDCFREENVSRYINANPDELGRGALRNARSRIRRVAAFVIPATTAPSAVSRTAPGRAVRPRPLSATVEPYPAEQWQTLQGIAAAAGESELLTAKPVGNDAWTTVVEGALRHGIELTRQRLVATHLDARLHCEQHPAFFHLHLLLDVAPTATRNAPLNGRELHSRLHAHHLRHATQPAQPPDHDDCTNEGRRHRALCRDLPDAPVRAAAAPSGGPLKNSTTTPARQKKPRRASARQVLLAAKRAEEGRNAHLGSLPDEVKSYIRRTYRPRSGIAENWEHLRKPVEDTLAASQVRGVDSMRKHVMHLAHFFNWAHRRGLDLEPGTLNRANLNIYEREALHNVSPSTRSTRRSRLGAIADHLDPVSRPVKHQPIPHQAVAAPYTPDEMAVICRVAQSQRTPLLQRQFCLLVALGAGAGIDSPDIKYLRHRDITDHGPDKGIEIRVHSQRYKKGGGIRKNKRTVWLMRDYEPLLREALTVGGPPDQLLIGTDPRRANVTTRVFSRAFLSPDAPPLLQSRLRTTWLATLMQRPIPLNVLLTAAGLSTARTLCDLLPHLPLPTSPDAHLR